MTEDDSARPPKFSYAKLAFCSIGAATAVLVLTAVVIGLIRPGPNVGLAIALVGVLLAVAALGLVATRITNRAFGTAADAPEKK